MDPLRRSACVRGGLPSTEVAPVHVVEGALAEADPGGWLVRWQLQSLGLESVPIGSKVISKKPDDRRTIGLGLGAKPAQQVQSRRIPR